MHKLCGKVVINPASLSYFLGRPGYSASDDTNSTGKRLARIANIVFSASELDNSNKDLQPKMSLNYDVLLRSALKLRVGYRTRAKPKHAHFVAFLLTLTLAQTLGHAHIVTSP